MEYLHLMKYSQHKKFCKRSFANEICRLEQGVGGVVKGRDTILFINYDNIPSESRRDIIYVYILVDYLPQKDEPNRT